MVSVCIATYNGQDFIKQQIDSILKQISKDDEIVISDDSSTDSTIDILRSYNDNRIKIYPNQKFHSPTFNFENAIKQANGDYVFLCDQDDIWAEGRVDKVLKALNTYDFVMCGVDIIDAENKVTRKTFLNKDNFSRNFLYRLWRNPYLGCAMAFRKGCLDYLLPFPSNLVLHDVWIGHLCHKLGKFKFIDEPLHLYRRYDNNYSGKPYAIWYRFYWRAYLVYNMIKRIKKYRHE